MISSILGYEKHDFVQAVNTEAKEKKAYILLDRRYRNEQKDNTTTWYILLNQLTTNNGVCVNDVRNITKMRIGNFFLKNTSSSAFGVMSRMTIFIPEFQSQCILNVNRNFHFMASIYSDNANVQPPTYAILSTADYGVPMQLPNPNPIHLYTQNNGEFNFNPPMTLMNSISINFATPYNAYTLHDDTFGLTYNGSGIITTASPHGLQTGLAQNERVYISNFTTSQPVADGPLITLLNREIGFLASGISSTQIQLVGYPDETLQSALSFPALVGTPMSNALVYLDFYRFFIEMELTYIPDLYTEEY